MASRNSARLGRRLVALTTLAGKAVRLREQLREDAKAGAVIRAALARASIDPAAISALRLAAEAERDLLQIGDSAELARADAAFRAADAHRAAYPKLAAKAAGRAADFAGRPPPGRGASLIDWYAWALAAGQPPRQSV